eukprot:COSAG01_NODE_793_length_13551_cov_466.357419_9_plen_102_part_00
MPLLSVADAAAIAHEFEENHHPAAQSAREQRPRADQPRRGQKAAKARGAARGRGRGRSKRGRGGGQVPGDRRERRLDSDVEALHGKIGDALHLLGSMIDDD